MMQRTTQMALLPHSAQMTAADKTLSQLADMHIKKGCEIYNVGGEEINARANKLYREALKCLNKIEDKDASVYSRMGMLYEWLRDYEYALHYIDIALSVSDAESRKDNAEFWKAVILYEGFQRSEEATDIFKRCLARATDQKSKEVIRGWLESIHKTTEHAHV